jgi:hypothetical protein
MTTIHRRDPKGDSKSGVSPSNPWAHKQRRDVADNALLPGDADTLPSAD